MTQEAITSYDAMGREVSSTDQNTGEVTTTTYDFMGRVVKTERSLTDQEGNKTSQTETKSYNANGAVTSETSSAGVTTEYRYDSRNRVTITKEEADNTTKTTETSYGYETAVIHTLTGTKTYKDLQVQTTKVNGTVTDKTWTDHAGNAVRTLSNGIYTDHVFTEDGKEIAAVTLGSSTDGEGKISLTLYNKEGKTTHTISQPVVDGDSITTGKDTIINETAYDVNGNESAVTDGNGNVTTYTYDDQNRVTGVSRKNGNETISNSISYDMGADGKTTTSVKDANGHVNKEVTNEAGLTESTTDLGDGEEQITTAYSYDTNGNKIRETYADGGYKTFDHDRKNRLIKTESYEAGEAGESIGEKTLKTVYSYDINDRLLESIDYQIDGSEETAVRYTEYQYDRRGQTTGYAELSQENEPTADEIKAHQIRYHYDSDGKLTKVTYPTTKNGVHALSYEYDQNGWLTKIKGEVQSADTSTEKTVRSYTYDSYGKVKEIKDYRDLLNSSEQAVKKAYTYDSLDRVREMTYTDLETGKVMESYHYSYDKNSNITEKTEVNNYPKEDTDKVNETKAYTYDALGRLTKTVTTDHKNDDKTKTVTYTYDAENRLSKVSVTDKDGKTAVIQQNRYNGDGQRIQKVEGSKTTNYYYQDGVVSYTTDGDNSQTSQNLIGTDGNILATQRYGSDHTDYLLYHKDIQGSTTSLVKEDGSADATYRYTDFGETTINGDNKAENEVCYTGGIYDQSTGLYYLNARYYNPEDGGFLTEDTYRGETNEPNTQNLYAYCANNPVNYVDPSGHLFFSAGVEFTISFVATYKNTTQITIDTHGNFTIENSRSYGIRIAWPKYSKAGFFMVGSGYIDKNKEEKRFDIGADVEVGGFSFSAGLGITNGSASAYFSGSYSPKKYSAAKGYLKILKPKEISPHAYVVCGDRMGRISISSFLKKKKNYKIVRYVKREKVTIVNKGKYMKVSFKGKKFEVRNKSIKIAK